MMTIKTENWLGEFVSSIGTGDAILGGAIDGFAGFSNVGGDVDVYYTIIDGLDKETGIGTLSAGRLIRKEIHATLVSGIYVKNGAPLNLSGDAQVYGTANSKFLSDVYSFMAVAEGNAGLIKNIQELQINGHPLTASFDLTADDVGARPNSWTPSADDVGARPNSWTPSADDVNAYSKAAADIKFLQSQSAEPSNGLLMRVGGATILDAERYALERATGGQQTVIYDAAGNANAMFVLPRFTYADLGMTAAMGTGNVTAFDFGSGSIKGEIFIGAYLASGSGAVSAPRQDPRASLDHTAARAACAAKGAGWHLMTVHEWAAIALWCMANGYEPIGNSNWGRSHAKTWMVGDRADNRAPGDASGIGRTQTGSMGAEATHTRTLGGIADLVGNVWEWQDGLLLQDGRFKISAYNTQAEVDWAFVNAYLDASSPSGGSAILSSAITNRLGPLGSNDNAGYATGNDWRSMTKAGGYVSNQLLKRLLLEPATVLPQGGLFVRNYGERLTLRGCDWPSGASAGLAALALYNSRDYAATSIGFRPAFA